MKKIVKVGNKIFTVDDEGKTEEVEQEKEEETTEEKEEETSEDEEATEEAEEATEEATEEAEEEDEEKLDEKVDEAAEKIMAKLDPEAIKEKVLKSLKKEQEASDKKVASLIDLEKLMKKDVSEMTAKEKIVGFFQAMVRADHAALKSLSEGTASEGGYLFPDEFRAEIIRDLEEMPHMRSRVTVIPMKRDVMKIPGLVDGPKVYWTDERAAKSTNYNGYKLCTKLIEKTVNCWEALMRVISRQAIQAIG